MRPFAVALATAGGAGFAPKAPGTVGSLIGVGVAVLAGAWPAGWQVALLTALVVLGTWSAGEAARHFGHDDPGQVVIDEVAGQYVTVFLVGTSPALLAAGFLLFRIFDIAKPWPVRRVEALPGGVGIMADDLMAGLYGLGGVHVLGLLWPAVF